MFATDELGGGILGFNFPGGTGQMKGAVSGKLVDTTVGQRAKKAP